MAERRWHPPRPARTARATGPAPVVAIRTCTCVNHYCSHHQALRAQWALRVATGRESCWRCGKGLAPDQPWDLGHDDQDKTIYRGPECRPCNRSTMTRRQPSPVRRWEL